jgi:HlyD family secretion protein
VIIDRRVNIGQTVVASLNAPSLFLIAKDLRRMQVWVAVNEADIGSIHPGQPVHFTVDAFPDRQFEGSVGKIRLNASMTQNVVTYTVEVVTDNSDGTLLPYLTANVLFELDRREDVLLVPNAALRWTPSTEMVTPEFRAAADSDIAYHEDINNSESPLGAVSGEAKNTGVLWVVQGTHVRPIAVRVGPMDGSRTEVSGEGVTEGLEVVTGFRKKAAEETETSNPFTPKIPKGAKGRPPPPP